MSAHEGIRIRDSTDLYYDLGLMGEDLHDVLAEIGEQFGTDFAQMNLRRYAPDETGFLFDLNLIRSFYEWRGKRAYQSLTVKSLVDAIRAGRWENG